MTITDEIRTTFIYSNAEYLKCWITLCLDAENGQLCASERTLAESWGVSYKFVRIFLAKLVEEGFITREISYKKTKILIRAHKNEVQGAHKNSMLIPCNSIDYGSIETSEGRTETPQGAHKNSMLIPCNSIDYGSIETSEGRTGELFPEKEKEKEQERSKEIEKEKEREKERNIKERKENESAPVGATNIEERKRKFYNSMIPFVSQYPPNMLREFYNYWSETNRSNTKMRCEYEKTWDLKLRLITWNRNQTKYANRTSNTTSTERAISVAEAIERLANE